MNITSPKNLTKLSRLCALTLLLSVASHPLYATRDELEDTTPKKSKIISKDTLERIRQAALFVMNEEDQPQKEQNSDNLSSSSPSIANEEENSRSIVLASPVSSFSWMPSFPNISLPNFVRNVDWRQAGLFLLNEEDSTEQSSPSKTVPTVASKGGALSDSEESAGKEPFHNPEPSTTENKSSPLDPVECASSLPLTEQRLSLISVSTAIPEEDALRNGEESVRKEQFRTHDSSLGQNESTSLNPVEGASSSPRPPSFGSNEKEVGNEATLPAESLRDFHLLNDSNVGSIEVAPDSVIDQNVSKAYPPQSSHEVDKELEESEGDDSFLIKRKEGSRRSSIQPSSPVATDNITVPSGEESPYETPKKKKSKKPAPPKTPEQAGFKKKSQTPLGPIYHEMRYTYSNPKGQTVTVPGSRLAYFLGNSPHPKKFGLIQAESPKKSNPFKIIFPKLEETEEKSENEMDSSNDKASLLENDHSQEENSGSEQ